MNRNTKVSMILLIISISYVTFPENDQGLNRKHGKVGYHGGRKLSSKRRLKAGGNREKKG